MTNTHRVTFKTIYFNEEDGLQWMKNYFLEMVLTEYLIYNRAALHRVINKGLPNNESLLGIDYIREL